jgi:hypothetical protein
MMDEANLNDVYLQADRHQNERRRWHEQALDTNALAEAKHRQATGKVFSVLVVRALIEFGILAVLVTLLVRA